MSEKEELKIGNEIFVPFISEADILKRVKEIGDQISIDYKGKTPVFIGVLNGASLFMSDLIRNVQVDCEIDYFKLSSYGDDKISSGNVKLIKEIGCDVEGRDILIVEDIVDTGLSIKFIEDLMDKHKPANMKVVTLLMKPDSLKYNVKIDYIGFNIPSKFVIGYGLDYAQRFRNLRSIYVLKED